jgi:hypothetical protein
VAGGRLKILWCLQYQRLSEKIFFPLSSLKYETLQTEKKSKGRRGWLLPWLPTQRRHSGASSKPLLVSLREDSNPSQDYCELKGTRSSCRQHKFSLLSLLELSSSGDASLVPRIAVISLLGNLCVRLCQA